MDNAVSGLNFSNYSGIKVNAFTGGKDKSFGVSTKYKTQSYDDVIDYNSIGTYEDVYAVESTTQKWYEDITEWYKKARATECVAATTLASGVLKIYEYAEDGLTWLGGMAVSGIAKLVGADEFSEKVEEWTMDEIARDKVGELNKAFYEGTELGKAINDASAMKYDSKLAKGIQNVTTEVVIIAGATAATIATGGAAAPLFAAGFVVGAGQSAEKNFQDTENRDFWKDSVEIGVDGTIKGLSTVAYGKAGAAAFNGVKSLTSNGVKTTLKETLGAFNKTTIKSTIKNSGKKIAKQTALETLYDTDTILESGAVLLDDAKTFIQTGEINFAKVICDAALIYGENYVGNLTSSILSDSVKKIDRMKELYEQGQDMARGDYNVGFKSYREHAEKHVYYVADYMQDISKDVDGINLDETLFASLSHDLGMKGGYVKYNGKYVKADDVMDMLESSGETIGFGDINKYVRKPHPLNSALTVLTDDIIPEGVDKDVVALLAMSHSKSTSGITYFDNKNQWNNCVDELTEALKQYNKDNSTSFAFDSTKLKNMINDPDEFARLQKQALIIRDGDAMSKVATIDGNTIMQTGEVSEIVNKNPRKSFDDPVLSEDHELSGLSDKIKSTGEDVSSGVKYHVGELNTKFSSKTDGMSYYKASVSMVEPNQTPHSTWYAIEERIGEVKTYSNCKNREFVINLPADAKGSELHNWYDKSLKDYKNELIAGFKKDLKENLIDIDTYNRQIDFVKNIEVKCGG